MTVGYRNFVLSSVSHIPAESALNGAEFMGAPKPGMKSVFYTRHRRIEFWGLYTWKYYL